MKTTASWCGFAALGSGLILCAVAAGADPPIAAPLVAVAAVELVWGAAALRSGRVPTPRMALVIGAVVVALAIALLFAGVVGVIPLLALLVLHWTAAVLTVLALRRGRAGRVRLRRSRPASLVLILTAQAMLVAAITTPALAHTSPGESAVPHGTLHSPLRGPHAH